MIPDLDRKGCLIPWLIAIGIRSDGDFEELLRRRNQQLKGIVKNGLIRNQRRIYKNVGLVDIRGGETNELTGPLDRKPVDFGQIRSGN